MSQTAITLAFEQWKAQQGATGEAVLLDEFVFANVPGLDPEKPIDRSEGLPPTGQIVFRQAVTRKGVVNENAVVHSVVLGADVGDFSFNWIGLINKTTGTLAMIVHAPVQQKLKTSEGQQGNVLTRSFLMEYNGAQAETGINTPAETWQIDFTARMAGMDERQRLENTDIYGAAAFLGDGWLVGKNGNQYFVTQGAGYVAGLRAELPANKNITVAAKPVKVWLDVCWSGSLTSVWTVTSKLTMAETLADYLKDGVQHYVFALASIDADGAITDLRPKGSLDNQQGNTDFMRRDKNLADVKNVAEARKSLDLGSAATRNVAGNAAGELVAVGYKGNLGSECNRDGFDFSTYPFVTGERLFTNLSFCSNVPSFLANDYYYIEVVAATNPSLGGRYNRPLILFVSYSNSNAIYGIREDDGQGIGWRYFRTVQFDGGSNNVTVPGDAFVYDTLQVGRGKKITIYSSDSNDKPESNISIRNWGNASSGRPTVFEVGDGRSYLFYAQRNSDGSAKFSSAGDITAEGGINAQADITTARNMTCNYIEVNGNVVSKNGGVFESSGAVRVYSPNNPPPRSQYAAPNTAWWSGGQMWWRCGSTGTMSMEARVSGVPNGGRITFPTAFPNYCVVAIPTRNEEPGNGAAMQPYNVDNTGFNLRVAGGGNVSVMYTAKGY